MNEIADRRLSAAPLGVHRRGRRRDRSRRRVPRTGAGAERTAYDLVLISYLHLPRTQWGEALAAAVRATVVGGAVLVVAHAVRNLTEGVGGPQDPTILLDPEDVIASAAELPVDVELAQLRARDVEGADRPALDTVVLFRKRRRRRLTTVPEVDQ